MALSISNLGTVLEKLLAKTISGSLVWSDSSEPTEYKSSTDKFFYYIKTRDEDGLSPYRFQVWSRSGSPNKLGEEVSADFDGDVSHLFAELHERAFMSASGLTRELSEEILSDLDDSEPF
jgi:hypothetical protein